MANEEHLAILRQGVEVWNRWRKENPHVRPYLRGANLHGVNLSGANLQSANLSSAELAGADLHGVDLSGASLNAANLIGANLHGADLTGAYLAWTTLIEANLTRTNLLAAILDGADLSWANLGGASVGATYFGDNDLSQVKGLDTLHHHNPSTIGIDTLYQSGGKIPDGFLRGCGVPDALIEYLPSLLGAMEPIQFYSCFISYSHKDEDFARRIHSQMRITICGCGLPMRI
jgi:hypothetical protein